MNRRHLAFPISRRELLRNLAGLAVLATNGPRALTSLAQAAEPAKARKTIGIQVGAVSFVDEGTEKVLDILQQQGAIDTIYLTTFT